jgi:hypothetical protein
MKGVTRQPRPKLTNAATLASIATSGVYHLAYFWCYLGVTRRHQGA